MDCDGIDGDEDEDDGGEEYDPIGDNGGVDGEDSDDMMV